MRWRERAEEQGGEQRKQHCEAPIKARRACRLPIGERYSVSSGPPTATSEPRHPPPVGADCTAGEKRDGDGCRGKVADRLVSTAVLDSCQQQSANKERAFAERQAPAVVSGYRRVLGILARSAEPGHALGLSRNKGEH